MNALVVHAHPDPTSFSRHLLDRAVAGLESSGHTCQIIDLYGLDYQAAMSRSEHVAYSTPNPILDDTVAAHAASLGTCEILVLVYPTWWSAMPAILKGWIERTFVPGTAFGLDDASGRIAPLLGNVRHVVGITTHGSPWWYVKLVNDNGRRTATRALRGSTGLRTKTTWLAMYDLDSRSDLRREAFLDRVERTMAELK